jgi:hypothetical protein
LCSQLVAHQGETRSGFAPSSTPSPDARPTNEHQTHDPSVFHYRSSDVGLCVFYGVSSFRPSRYSVLQFMVELRKYCRRWCCCQSNFLSKHIVLLSVHVFSHSRVDALRNPVYDPHKAIVNSPTSPNRLQEDKEPLPLWRNAHFDCDGVTFSLSTVLPEHFSHKGGQCGILVYSYISLVTPANSSVRLRSEFDFVG